MWQTIDTAPKDGTAFLGWNPNKSGYVADQRYTILHCNGDWKYLSCSSGYRVFEWEYTHWMPLPAPPTQSDIE